jgi:hypothetical protein
MRGSSAVCTRHITPISMNQPKPLQIRLPFTVPRPKKGQEPIQRVCGMFVSFHPLCDLDKLTNVPLDVGLRIVDILVQDVILHIVV